MDVNRRDVVEIAESEDDKVLADRDPRLWGGRRDALIVPGPIDAVGW